jgi:Predicted membrane protein (DUF2231)
MLTVDGIPAHPLVVHAVVVLLPLAAVGTLLVVARRAWRRHLGVWVLLLAVVGVAAVPIATQTGEQLKKVIGNDPLIEIHEHRADTLLVPALVFLLLLAATVLAGRRADGGQSRGPGAAHAVMRTPNTATLDRVTLVTGVLAALAGLAVTGLVVWIGHAGSAAAWSGVVG